MIRIKRLVQVCGFVGSRRGLLTIKKFSRPDKKQVQANILSPPTLVTVQPSESDAKASTVRLAKRIAMSGLCSRREAEKRIQSFDVTVNGHVVFDVATSVDSEYDVVAVDGRVLPKTQQVKIWMAHKLKGELVTTSDPQGRATIFDRLRVMGLTQHMMPVGRLDYNTEGLLLLTNNGDYARELEHPKTGVTRVYRAFVRGNVTESKLQELKRGPLIEGVKYRPMKVTVQSTDKKDSWLRVQVAEGKNREVRKAMAHVRLIVKQLIRVQYGPYRLADLPAGAVLAVRAKSLDKPQARTNDDE